MKKHIVAAAMAFSVMSFTGVAFAGAGAGGVEGTLSKIEGEFYYVTTKDGKEIKGHFNDKTAKKGDIKQGAMVMIYVDDKGHTTKIEEHKH